jgi:hypothetical protein
MFKVTLTLPVEQHDGTSNNTTIETIKLDIARLFGGYSSTSITGGWYDRATGHMYNDSSVMVWTYVESRSEVEQLKQLAADWAVDLQQIALYLNVSQEESYEIAGTRSQAYSA